MGSNVRSNFWLCNMVLPQMAGRGGGAIIVISSIAGIRGTPTLGAYGILHRGGRHGDRAQLGGGVGAKNIRATASRPAW